MDKKGASFNTFKYNLLAAGEYHSLVKDLPRKLMYKPLPPKCEVIKICGGEYKEI